MTDVSDKRSGPSARSGIDPSLFYNPTARAIFYQAALVIGVALLAWWLQSNAAANMAAQGRATGFSFLNQTAGFNISFSLIPFDRSSTYFEVYIVGILNTLLVAVVGITLATILGFIIGIARLSSNFLIRKLAMVYVEIMRNMPLLLQLLFWYFMALNALPAVRQSYNLPFGTVLNQRGLYLPNLISDYRFLILLGVFVAAIALAVAWRKRRVRKMAEKGARLPLVLPMLAIIAIPTVLVYFIAQVPISCT